MTESQYERIREDARHDAVDDREAREREDYEAFKRCENCLYGRKGFCVNIESPFMGSETSYLTDCDEFYSKWGESDE